MCGIGGFSLAEGSKINPRKLSNALLTGLESRGNQASGFAWQSNRQSGFYKQDIAGSRLNLSAMPKKTATAILHTRLATHGPTSNNDNNHPVMSPNQRIALVHNGVIYNHKRVRQELPYKLPEVDTSVIPAILEKYGYGRFDMLDGDASLAWLDSSKTGILTVARFSHSPLFIAQVADGSFVFASTQAILTTALKRLGLKPVFLLEVAEGTLYRVQNGVIVEQDKLPITSPEYEEKVSASSYGKYRSMTAGNYHSYSYSNTWDSYPADDKGFADEYAEQFDEWTWNNFIEIDGFYYTPTGELVGDEQSLYEMFEDYRYKQYQKEQDDALLARDDYRLFFEDEMR